MACKVARRSLCGIALTIQGGEIMLGFITGLLLGGTLGAAVMALCNAAKSADEEMETKIK